VFTICNVYFTIFSKWIKLLKYTIYRKVTLRSQSAVWTELAQNRF